MNTDNIIIDGISYRLVKNEREWNMGNKFKVTVGRFKDRIYTVDLILTNGVVSNENEMFFTFNQIEKLLK